jgi:choline dehydrogenase-like flavoprotein
LSQSYQPQTLEYDVVIVGGGVAGAVIAHKLSRAGKHVLILEAGTSDVMDPAIYRKYLDTYYTMGGLRSLPNGPYPHNPDALSPNDATSTPYYVQPNQPNFLSDYLRMLGGSTLHWQGTSLRMVPNDFRMQSTYGQGVDWPVTYDDLEPGYREAEREIGVCADVEDQRIFGVWFPDGYVYPMKKMPQSVIDQFFDEKLRGSTVPLYGGEYPLRVISIPVGRNSTPNPAYDNGRGYVPVSAVGDRDSGNRCQGNSNCLPLCPVQAKYNALKTIAAALRTGKVDIRGQCVASRLLIDPGTGRITAVEYKRYTDPSKAVWTTETVTGKIVVLAANAIQNAVLMLASQVSDNSGQLGRNLMDHPYLVFFGLAPRPVWPFRGPDTTSGVESLRDGKFREKHASFRASLGNWGWSGEPRTSVLALLQQQQFGTSFRSQLRDRLNRMVKFGAMLEQLPDPNNRVTIDPAHTDALGNYLPVLSYSYADYTLAGAVAAAETVWPAITQRAGIDDQTSAIVPGGSQIVSYQGKDMYLGGSGHVVGTHRMGRDRNDSVVDSDLRSWSHPNLYAVGAGSMVTIGTANPTLTVVALSFRAADSILAELR